MRNLAALLCVGGLVAGLGWAFWHYLGNDAFTALSTLTLVVLLVDNARLRRRLRARRPGEGSTKV